MATIEKRTQKDGSVTYRITVAEGIDSQGRQIRHRKTWKPEPGMTPRQREKALARVAADFEREVEQGFQTASGWKFADYAAYVIALKERSGAKPRTIDRYKELLTRINQAIGHKKLTEIRPQHLNSFYQNLGEIGIRRKDDRARAKIDLAAWLKKHRLTRAELASRSKLSPSTVSTAVKGKPVVLATASAICAALDLPLDQVFSITKDGTALSAKTILEYHRLISTIFTQAEKEMLVLYNPASKATPPKAPRKEPDYYQPETMDAILDAMDHAPLKWKALVYLMIDTGCRRGEAVGCKWEKLDMEAGIWTIDSALLYTRERGTYEGTTKTGKPRKVSLSPETVALLKRHRRAQMELQLANGDRWVNSGYVFTREDGQRMNPDSVTCWLRKFSADHGLPHLHPHAFRHTAASNMIANGVDLVTAASELGHANATTTATIYAHQIETAKSKAGEARALVFRHRKQA